MLLNIGFIEAAKSTSADCFVFHDVDHFPESDYNFYDCSDAPIQYAVSINKDSYEPKFPEFAGGVTALSRKNMIKINGYSNLYFGWGREDDDFYRR